MNTTTSGSASSPDPRKPPISTTKASPQLCQTNKPLPPNRDAPRGPNYEWEPSKTAPDCWVSAPGSGLRKRPTCRNTMDTATNARRPLPLPREEKAPGCGPRYGNAASLRCQGGGTLATEFELMWADVVSAEPGAIYLLLKTAVPQDNCVSHAP